EPTPSTRFLSHIDPMLLRSCKIIRKHLHQQWSVGDIAQRLRVSEATLNRRLQQATGMSPHAWRNQRRLEHAQQLLADPLLSISHVQRRCGFGSLRSFHRLLHQHCGMGPEAYRRHLLLGGSAATL
ncbi:MAG: AraC family transcriptional regulator, partial [Planctomycetota bacterium]